MNDVLGNTIPRTEGVNDFHDQQPYALLAPTPRAKRNFGLTLESTYFLLMTVVPDFPTTFQRTPTSRLRRLAVAHRQASQSEWLALSPGLTQNPQPLRW